MMAQQTHQEHQPNFVERIMIKTFAKPEGLLGRIGGYILAMEKRELIAWLIDLLNVRAHERVLEVGFGPGVAIAALSVKAAHVAGVDISDVMVEQARARNAQAIAAGRVELHQGSADRLPFTDNSFDKALSINSIQIWPDPAAGLREIHRVLKPRGRLALGFVWPMLPFVDEAERLLAEAGFVTIRREVNKQEVNKQEVNKQGDKGAKEIALLAAKPA
ncbi:MAG TPA: methyltransferase domain-containing protein [Caldilineaceae bacterium]|nr:methyltransferase domain-containing protein [Caldilineaceae bacterium]